MDVLDGIIVVAAAAAVVLGWEMGFVARSLSWAGLGIGIFLGIEFAHLALRANPHGAPSAKLAVLIAIVAGTALVGQGLGLVVGSKVARFTMVGPLRVADRSLGALIGLVSVAVVVWILAPTLDRTAGLVANQARHSAIVKAIGRIGPEPPAGIRNLSQELQNGGFGLFPQVFTGNGASPDAGPPPTVTAVPASVAERAAQSTVKVTGTACNLILDGSGFTALAPDLVVTNAHVVAGETATFVLTPNGKRLRALVVGFDERRDVALLSVPDLQSADPAEVPLTLVHATVGSTAVTIGHPGGTDQIVTTPVGIADEVTAQGRDLYDRVDTQRDVYILSASIQQGDSGSPVIGAAGQAEGLVFALAPDRPNTGYALSVDEIRATYDASHLTPVSTGPCVDG